MSSGSRHLSECSRGAVCLWGYWWVNSHIPPTTSTSCWSLQSPGRNWGTDSSDVQLSVFILAGVHSAWALPVLCQWSVIQGFLFVFKLHNPIFYTNLWRPTWGSKAMTSRGFFSLVPIFHQNNVTERMWQESCQEEPWEKKRKLTEKRDPVLSMLGDRLQATPGLMPSLVQQCGEGDLMWSQMWAFSSGSESWGCGWHDEKRGCFPSLSPERPSAAPCF